MHIIVSGSRLELELTETQALQLIEQLSKGVAHCKKTGQAWFANGLTVEGNGKQAAGRITIRIEKD